MPAFMTIGKLNDSEPTINSIVDTLEDFQGDATAGWHKGWIMITSFNVEMKDEERLRLWEGRQSPPTAARSGGRVGSAASGGRNQGQGGAQGQSGSDGSNQKQREQRRNTLSLTKPTDSTSTRLLAWTQSQESHDIQIDCCTTEEEWPYMSLIFLGAFPTKSEIQDKPNDSVTFQWKRAVVLSYEFDSSGEYKVTDIAEFGEAEESSITTTADQRGLENFVAPAPTTSEGAERGAASRPMLGALTGSLPPVDAEGHAYDLERRRLRMDDVGSLSFALESVRGFERMSALFHYDVEMRSDAVTIDPKDIVGHEIKFRIEDERSEDVDGHEPMSRYYSGVVASFLAGEMASDMRRRYHAVVVPSAWKLTQRTNSRVYQEKSVVEVVEDVFGDDFRDYDTSGITKQYPKKPYIVQYQETDFAFVSRLLEEAGIFYYFKHEESGHTMMLCDGKTSYVSCPVDPLVFARDVHRDPRITAWREHYSYIPGKIALTDYNYETPAQPVKGQSSTQIDLPDVQKAEVFEYPGYFADNDEGTTVADLRLQERETAFHFVHAVGCYDVLQPGMTIKVHDRPGEDPNGPAKDKLYLVTGIRFQTEQLPEYGMSLVGYRGILTAIPEETPYVPPRVTPRPRIHGPQTAVVVGDKVSDEEVVDTDEYGRIKVQFMWDREGQKDKDSSCWIRVQQAAVGNGYGSMFIPRIGWEVVVTFLDGDPDRPLVTGCLVNELHKPYHELPTAKHKSVIMTRTFPDGGKENFNELTFHDEKDKEEIYFHAERDFKRVVEHDDVLEVGEKETGSQTITIEGDQTLTLNQGNREKKIAQGKETVTIHGDQSITIESGNQTTDVSSGKVTMTAAQSIELKVGGSSVKLSTSGIELKMGPSTVKIDAQGVQVKGMNVKVEGSVQTEVKGLMTKISGDGMLETKGGITMMQ